MKGAFFTCSVAVFGLHLSALLAGQTPTNDPRGWPHNPTTPTWEEGTAAFAELAATDERAHWMEIGFSDCGEPIHVLLLSADPLPMPGLPGVVALRESADDRLRLLINNAIHPGEPCGVDASLALARQLLGQPHLPDGMGDEAGEWDADAAGVWPTSSKRSWNGAPADWSDATIAIIPFYNVGGALNRGCCSRANQNGPLAYGFRGNARNFDLNRDFVKLDTDNAAAFARFFQAFDPDLFVDTHTTNGADYPYTMTCITTQPDKAGPVLGNYLRTGWDPALYNRMEAVGYPMSPYVYGRQAVPDSGLIGFLETPRYSTGYAALWGTLGFTAEAHMLKPYPERVQAMLNFLQSVLALGLEDADRIRELRREEAERIGRSAYLPVAWELDEAQHSALDFHGYAAVYEPSAITGTPRLRYDRTRPWNQEISFFNRYGVVDSVRVPGHYIVPRGWSDVVAKLRSNGISIQVVEDETEVEVEVTYLVDWHASSAPYEGHHMKEVDSCFSRTERVTLQPGDVLVPTAQRGRRYVVEVLELQGHDSFWAWGLFDSSLQRKEGYSAYVFEDTAEELLATDPELKARFQAAWADHPDWQEEPELALRWLYEHSPYAEASGGRYPVMKSVH